MYQKIFEEIARQNNCTVDEVYYEMQKAIECSNYYTEEITVEDFLTKTIHYLLKAD